MLGTGAFTENFRSALNGFNRTDVVQFIQRQTVEHEKAMRLLRDENARLKLSAADPRYDADALKAEKDELAQQLVARDQKIAFLQNQIAELTAQVDFLTKEKAVLTDSLRDAQIALAEAEESTKNSGAVETRPALDRPMAPPVGMAVPPTNFDELELAAYRRAEQTERMARERAASASERMQSIFLQADEKIVMATADMNLLLDAMRSNCEQMQTLMNNARNILTESSESLKVSANLSSVV